MQGRHYRNNPPKAIAQDLISNKGLGYLQNFTGRSSLPDTDEEFQEQMIQPGPNYNPVPIGVRVRFRVRVRMNFRVRVRLTLF